MEKHITLVGILNIVYRSCAILGAFILFTIASTFGYIMGLIMRLSHEDFHEIPPEVMEIAPIVLIIIGVLIVIVSIVGLIGAIGVLKRREWGRLTTLVISFFNLVHIPLGTILGVYSMWVLLNDETIRLFNPQHGNPIEKT